ncbi:MAG: TPM domain-containing protein [Bacteroidales bacterium]|nr:TPM domain-containing protein [Bacteroidales bacterium]
MKHIRFVCNLLLFAIILMVSNTVCAASLPKMKDKYVTDAAGILSKSELKQLREDVKAMCDYYSTQIAVAIVSTFGDYSIDEYAAELCDKWNVAQEDGMLVLVKPKSDRERGEVMLLASPDLQDVFPNSVCEEIVQESMIPHFKENDYFGGIEAVLEYMNSMSEESESSNYTPSHSDNYDKHDGEHSKEKGTSVFRIILEGLLAFVLIAILLLLIGVVVKFAVSKLNGLNKKAIPCRSSTYKHPTSSKKVVHKPETIFDYEIEEDNGYDYDEDEENDSYNYSEYQNRKRNIRDLDDLQDEVSRTDEGGFLKKAVVGALIAGGGMFALKNKDKVADTVKSVFGGGKRKRGRPRLGGKGGKPRLGGGNKPKRGGSSASGSW